MKEVSQKGTFRYSPPDMIVKIAADCCAWFRMEMKINRCICQIHLGADLLTEPELWSTGYLGKLKRVRKGVDEIGFTLNTRSKIREV